MSDKLCFVEDDPTISELVACRLRKSGFEVSVFAKAEDVLQTPSDFDLYILDWMLPGKLSGLELCDELRKRSATVPVLFLSALAEPNHRVEGLRVGADDYLTKPFEMEELLLRVSGMLRRRSGTAASLLRVPCSNGAIVRLILKTMKEKGRPVVSADGKRVHVDEAFN